jgi:hypothetical protein
MDKKIRRGSVVQPATYSGEYRGIVLMVDDYDALIVWDGDTAGAHRRLLDRSEWITLAHVERVPRKHRALVVDDDGESGDSAPTRPNAHSEHTVRLEPDPTSDACQRRLEREVHTVFAVIEDVAPMNTPYPWRVDV